MNKIAKCFTLLAFSTSLLNAESFSWTKYEKEIGFDYISQYENQNKLTPEEQTKKYIKRVHNLEPTKTTLKEIKEKRNDKIAVGLVFRNPKEFAGAPNPLTGVIESDELDSFGLRLSSKLDLSSIGMSSDKYANVNVFNDLVEISISKRLSLDEFDLGIFESFNRWNGPYVEAGVGVAYQIKETIKEEGLSPMVSLATGWNFQNEYEARYELSIPSDYQKGTLSRFSINSLF